MSDWLNIQVVFGALVVTTFACVGLLALWVATSLRPWFVRMGAGLLILSMCLLIPAYGPFVTFLLATCLVVVSITAYRGWGTWRERKKVTRTADLQPQPAHWQFSMKSAFALCTIVAVLVTIVVRIPAETWSSAAVIATALVLSILILLASWVVGGKRPRRERSLVAIGTVLVLIGGAQIANSHDAIQPPIVADDLEAYFSIYENGAALLLGIAAGLFVTLVISLLLFETAYSSPEGRSACRRIQGARTALIAYGIVLTVFPIYVFTSLIRPLSEPDNALPRPNGYDEVEKLARSFEKGGILKELAADSVNTVTLDAAVSTYDAEFAAVRKWLGVPFRVPIQYDYNDIDSDVPIALRTLARVINTKADASRRKGDFDESLQCEFDILQLSQSSSRGGLLIHFLVASAIENTATAGLYDSIPLLNANQCRTAVAMLWKHDLEREAFENVLFRERAWISKTLGWLGRLSLVLDDIVASEVSIANLLMWNNLIYPRDKAITRLLTVDLALRAFQLDHGRLPADLDALVPDYLPELPSDPFSPTDDRLHFERVENKGYALWSVGSDQINNNGQPLPKNEFGIPELSAGGDLRLDDYFAPIAE